MIVKNLNSDTKNNNSDERKLDARISWVDGNSRNQRTH
jgi:hypothetical protein